MASDTQKLTRPMPGTRVTAARENKLITQNQRMIVGGDGIVVQRMGDQFVIHAKKQPGGGVGVGGIRCFKAPTAIANLPDPEEVDNGSLGRIEGGALDGMMCVIGPGDNAWRSFTHWE